MSSSHEMLGEGHVGVEVEMEASALGSAARDTVSLSASVPSGVVIGSAVFVVRHFVAGLLGIFLSCCWGFLIYLYVYLSNNNNNNNDNNNRLQHPNNRFTKGCASGRAMVN